MTSAIKKEMQSAIASTTPSTPDAPATRPQCLLEAFEHIVEHARDSNLNPEFFVEVAEDVSFAERVLGLEALQVVLLALFVDKSDDRSIYMSEIASYIGCRTTRLLRLADHIDVLEKKRYIRASRAHDRLSFRVPQEVIKAIRENRAYIFERVKAVDTYDFFERFDKIIQEKKNDELTTEALMEATDELLEDVKHTAFARAINSCYLSDEDRLLFIFMAHLFVENNDDAIGFRDLRIMYNNDEVPSWVKRELHNRISDLFDQKLIENANEDGLAKPDVFKLTDDAKSEILCELDLGQVGRSGAGLIKADSLVSKQLIYNAAEEKQISELASILSEKRFVEVQSRLREAGMRTGFCCLLYGAPGTGKTETVYQLARLTGRDIMRVDVDKIKSCWVGESEKNIKTLFDRYRAICKESPLAPILLFNEADAVLGVRMEGASRAVDKMENSIQNIILQEMETLEGIMIATTNLTSNLDGAFERRFLYKIRYERPTPEARARIWQIMLPGLTYNDASTLSRQFDLSGGEIENIARKHSVGAILSGREEIDLAAIAEACRAERIGRTNATRIGF